MFTPQWYLTYFYYYSAWASILDSDLSACGWINRRSRGYTEKHSNTVSYFLSTIRQSSSVNPSRNEERHCRPSVARVETHWTGRYPSCRFDRPIAQPQRVHPSPHAAMARLVHACWDDFPPVPCNSNCFGGGCCCCLCWRSTAPECDRVVCVGVPLRVVSTLSWWRKRTGPSRWVVRTDTYTP